MANRRSTRKRKAILPPTNSDHAIKSSFWNEIQNPIIFNDFKSYFTCSSVEVCIKRHKKNEGKIYLMNNDGSFNAAVPDDICKLYSVSLISGEVLDEKFFRAALYTIAIADDFTSRKVVRLLKSYLRLHPPCDENFKDYYKNIISAEFQCSILASNYYMFTLSNVLELLLEVLEHEENEKNSVANKSSIITFIDDMAKIIDPGKAEEFPSSILCRIFDVILDIIHQNLIMSLIKRFQKKGKLSKKDQPILSSVVWNTSDVGGINDHCKMAFKIFCIAPEECISIICRYIAMLAEVARISDQQNRDDGSNFYPNFGKLCNDFASTLSSFLSESKTGMNKIEYLQPLWLKMLVSKYFLKVQLNSDVTLSTIVAFIKKNLVSLIKSSPRNKNVLNLTDGQQKVLLCLIDSYLKVYRVNLKSDSTIEKTNFVFEIDHNRCVQDEAAFSQLVTLVDKISFENKETFQVALSQI